MKNDVGGLEQDCSNSSVLVVELLQSCSKLSVVFLVIQFLRMRSKVFQLGEYRVASSGNNLLNFSSWPDPHRGGSSSAAHSTTLPSVQWSCGRL